MRLCTVPHSQRRTAHAPQCEGNETYMGVHHACQTPAMLRICWYRVRVRTIGSVSGDRGYLQWSRRTFAKRLASARTHLAYQRGDTPLVRIDPQEKTARSLVAYRGRSPKHLQHTSRFSARMTPCSSWVELPMFNSDFRGTARAMLIGCL